jgi:hypothetical protein
MKTSRFGPAAAAYLAVTFPVAYVWHLVVFKGVYDRLGIFNREEPIVALGFLTIAIQGLVLSYLYPAFYRGGAPAREGLRFGLLMGVFLWSSQVVAAAAKHQVSSLPTWLAIETAYFAAQFILVGLAIGLVYGRLGPRGGETGR